MTQQPRDSRARFSIEQLEQRIAPGILRVSPNGVMDPGADYVRMVPDAARPGLETAQEHSRGVISWSIGG
mgnify:CR=1 FL=1